ncbi:MAG: PAS domain S-box protein, partial [Candidatus Electrothrix sp. AR4]|nr:PAS domain S-box protein [Candidatus Electrothrix sp. AR4]
MLNIEFYIGLEGSWRNVVTQDAFPLKAAGVLMNISSQKKRIQHDTSIRYSIFTTFIPSAVLPLGCATLFTLYVDHWYWINEPFHAFVESAGSFSAVILSVFIIIMRRNQQLDASYLWVAATLMGMGILDGFHAAVSPGKTFVWLHSLATLIGGLTFALIILPQKVATLSQVEKAPYITGLFSVLLGSFSLLFPESIPLMAEDGKFSLGAVLMNTLGGAGFIIAWLHFCRRNLAVSRHEQLLLGNHCLLFGMAAILFHFSLLWDATWWLWHLLRLLAYLVILYFFLSLYNQKEKWARDNQVELKKRTEELEHIQRRLADIIEYSPTIITLKDISGKFILVNKQFHRIFGERHENIVGKTTADILPADKAEISDKEDKKVISSSCSTEVEEEYLLDSKMRRTFIADRFPLRDINDEIYGIGCIMTDITERKITERKSEQLLTENTERIKELNCLYGLSKLAEHSSFELMRILPGMVELIASSWQHVEYTGVRIVLNDQEVKTDNFIETKWIQEAPVLINEEIQGRIQICYANQT